MPQPDKSRAGRKKGNRNLLPFAVTLKYRWQSGQIYCKTVNVAVTYSVMWEKNDGPNTCLHLCERAAATKMIASSEINVGSISSRPFSFILILSVLTQKKSLWL